MASTGYTRISSFDQHPGMRLAALKAPDCDEIRAQRASGTRFDCRTELQVLLDFL
jgi:DNA invertase Pin-like site-specific DNA recombinase